MKLQRPAHGRLVALCLAFLASSCASSPLPTGVGMASSPAPSRTSPAGPFGSPSDSGADATATVAPATLSPTNPGVFNMIVTDTFAGYQALAKGSEFTEVEARWQLPPVQCSAAEPRDAMLYVWVGLDDGRGTRLQQIGTGGFCAARNPHPRYFAWYDLYPDPTVPSTVDKTILGVRPGDEIEAKVLRSGGTYALSLSDLTTNQQFGVTRPRASPAFRAMWLVEADSKTRLLSRFSSVALTGCGAATYDGRGPVAGPYWRTELLTMDQATTGALDALANTFVVGWRIASSGSSSGPSSSGS